MYRYLLFILVYFELFIMNNNFLIFSQFTPYATNILSLCLSINICTQLLVDVSCVNTALKIIRETQIIQPFKTRFSKI